MSRLAKLGFILTAGMVAIIVWVVPTYAANCYVYTDSIGHVCTGEATQPTFVQPEPFADSFISHRTYARLNDLINVYAAPSLTAPIVRNVGDGFLFVTVQNAVESEGELWYVINYDEYVRASDLRVVDDSSFAGVQVTQQPERPFGWVLAPVHPSREPGAEPEPGTPKLDRYTFFQVYDAVPIQEPDQEWIWYNIGGGYWVRQTFVSLVDASPRPEEVGANEYWVEVDLYEQSFAAYEGDRMVYAGLISSGLNRWPTNEGLFQVWSRHTEVKMSGAEGKVDYYFIEDVPHTMFFDDEIALHGAYWHDRFGYKHSHGCVNMPPLAAEWVFNWSEEAPNDLWVWVHTSDPHGFISMHADPITDFAGP
ncbi:MAG: L,D-transpeptidase [Chloroflexota bacterium]|nr:L,D-transpeptidase [Anaerolineales bacterium]MCB8965290.1 L,D-transpeptidase [Ardenticatenaceae bacterium]